MQRSALGLAVGLALLVSGGYHALGDDTPDGAADPVTIEQLDDRCRVLIGGELFTEYIFGGYEKPILYPVIGPHGIGMTRNYPMRKDVAGEATDHPHHKSLWFSHQPINGVNFWTTHGNYGKCVHDKLLTVQGGGSRGLIRAASRWVTKDGTVVFTDTRTLAFQSLGSARVIDWEITIEASQGPVTFGDCKEGTMAIRTHPNLRLENDPGHGVTTAGGQAVNSEGVRGRDVWGKRADWIDYWGTIENKVVGIAIFDHPANPRHPTHWMARHYGYVGANPFALNAFEGKPRGTGDMTIPAGEKVTFRYRFLFHEGDPQKAQIAQHYRDYAEAGESVKP
ncbi:MAG: PmoA family protein [Planctomycetes bacterium]|nr:PmoA family protein [Planctomycetota bacterium]